MTPAARRADVADVAVVGLGALGSALACQLALRGVRVVGIDRFHPPHDQGSSHGHTRITRRAVGEGAAYVPLVTRSHALWPQLEAMSGETLWRRTGVLLVAAPAAAHTAYHGQAGFFERTLALAQAFGIDHERLDARAVRERFPAFAPRDDERAYFEPGSGVLFPEACVRAQLAVAARHGAQLRGGERLLDLDSTPGGVRLRTDRGELHAAQAVLCTGAWLPGQVGAPLAGRLRVLRQVLHWLATDAPAVYDPAACPAFMWLHGAGAEDAFYGFPRVDGRPGVKVATEQFRVESDPDAVDRGVDAAELRTLFEHHVGTRLRGLRPEALAQSTCLYTMAADGGFVVDRHPRHDRVTIVSPCSGHGFKHSAGLGEALAQRLCGETPQVDLTPFALGAAG